MTIPRLLLLSSCLVFVTSSSFQNVSLKCLEDTMDFLLDLNSKEPKTYAILMYDALGKVGSAILNGNMDRIGLYSECVSVTAPSGNFRGEYCKLHVEQEGAKFVIGICVPNSCSSHEITSLTNMDILKYSDVSFLPPLPNFLLQNDSSLTVASTVCSAGLFPMDSFTIVCICISGVLIILPIFGSIYVGVFQFTVNSSLERLKIVPRKRKQGVNSEHDKLAPAITRRKEQIVKSYGTIFTPFIENGKRIPTGFQPCGRMEQLVSLPTVVMACLLTICKHITIKELISDNSFEWKARVLEKPLYIYALSGPVYLGVDSFFLLSGFRSIKEYLTKVEGVGSSMVGLTTVMKYIYKRIIRLQPLHLASVCLSIGLISLVNWGSFWELPKHQWDNCRSVWWSNILLITNYVSVAESCSGWAWYLSNDFQFHLTTPFLIFLYVKCKRVMFVVVTLLFLVSSLVTILLSYYLHLSINYPTGERLSFNHTRLNYWVEYYTKPYCRYGPFLVVASSPTDSSRDRAVVTLTLDQIFEDFWDNHNSLQIPIKQERSDHPPLYSPFRIQQDALTLTDGGACRAVK
ncbi:nose resistant to fluoxetine 6-like [Pelobates cultripes]|uniref:Nose resistant to fluoxetine 6-like n=1 Tax=Pelobates cultripes TaxID=61616 RepID=A0AAD1SDY6_PELCU|nr:nose resistant to fluoxetine 6-like [Pelobates cultripes]